MGVIAAFNIAKRMPGEFACGGAGEGVTVPPTFVLLRLFLGLMFALLLAFALCALEQKGKKGHSGKDATIKYSLNNIINYEWPSS